MKIYRPRGVRILTTGSYLPARVVSNQDLMDAGAPLSVEDILRLCGVRTRHWAGDGEATSDLAVAAARVALAGLEPGRAIDRILLGTVSPDHPSPATACLVQAALGLPPVPACDLVAACSGFLYVLDAAARAVDTGGEHVLAIAADVRSRYLDITDRATCALFGDGAGAAVLGPGPAGSGLLGIGLAADGTGAGAIRVPAGGSREPASAATVAGGRHFIRMPDGPQIYVHAVSGMLEVASALLADLGLEFSDVALLIPHQANLHVLRRLAWKAGLDLARVHVNVDRVGNISGATVAVALDEALRSGKLQAGDKVLLVAAGAGYTAGAALYEVGADLVAAVR
ncbi:MAG: beta-ketoacyl-ACP synthase 3 [Candidatus Sericytochromatia bacterium]|nr:beta-ketoacyl-ACP synthase 3 [Candidatus Tanganyikabacteria bacterium]